MTFSGSFLRLCFLSLHREAITKSEKSNSSTSLAGLTMGFHTTPRGFSPSSGESSCPTRLVLGPLSYTAGEWYSRLQMTVQTGLLSLTARCRVRGSRLPILQTTGSRNKNWPCVGHKLGTYRAIQSSWYGVALRSKCGKGLLVVTLCWPVLSLWKIPYCKERC